MSLRTTSNDDLNVLLVTPTGRDAELIENALSVANVQSEAVKDIASAVEVFRTRDIGALLIAEEALGGQQITLLTSALAKQPAWSALPIFVLTMGGKETFQDRRREQERLSLGDITLLERPIRVATLLSSVKAALHARSRQYERRTTEIAVRQSEKLALVGRLTSSIAHEINNPLEAVTNLLYLLDGTPLSEEQQRYLDTAQQELARVSQIAAQTLTFNRQRDVEGQASVAGLLDSVLVLYQGRLAGSQIIVERRYQNTEPFRCYPGELRQLFANLIGNAFDATRKGGCVFLRERAATHPKTGEYGVRITVADTGNGMSAEVKAHLFEAFKSTKGNNGSGLGLWISKGIIEKHCGSIQCRSSTDPTVHGTVFAIFIPLHDKFDGHL
ncbi:MAG: HAMP domain-containing histidine kinase [Acidobacteriota bacterium]|nr:HAMP domain-containing histidine kinase [Acidobacteriota bacterium]